MLIGWPIAHLPFGSSPAYRLNLFAGVLASTAAVLVYFTALLALRTGNRREAGEPAPSERTAGAIGAAAGALAFAFGSTTWEHAVMYTPYILTAVCTGGLLYGLLRWWRCAEQYDSWKWLALLGVLFGLDFSVHRTNVLLIPAALVFVLIRHPKTVGVPRNILASVGGLLAGLSVQLLLIPIARVTTSDLNFGNPRDFSRWLNYFSLSQSGGSFFVRIYPRNAGVWRVQVADFLSMLSDNALHWGGASRIAGILPAAAAIIGLIAIHRRNRRLAMALVSLLVVQATMTVIFFNIPVNFFRSLDRHYLPVWVTIGVFISCGLAALSQWAAVSFRKRSPPLLLSAAMVWAVPAMQLLDNWHTHDASNRYFARDYAVNALKALPPNAIYFTVGDNDTFPLMYMQAAEHVRPDVRIVNLSVINYDDYPDQRHERDPTFPISLLSAERRELAARAWTDTALVLPFAGDNARFGLPPDTPTLDTGVFTVKPQWGDRMTLGELTVVDIVRTNAWRRPVTFSTTATRAGMAWLEPYARLEGMYWRIVPLTKPTANADALRRNLFSTYSYRGYADPTVRLDDFEANFGALYYEALSELVALDRAAGDTASCRSAVGKMMAAVPPARLVQREGVDGVTVPRCN